MVGRFAGQKVYMDKEDQSIDEWKAHAKAATSAQQANDLTYENCKGVRWNFQ